MRRLALVATLVIGAQLALAQPAHAANNMVYLNGTVLHISGQLYPMHATVRMSGGSFVVDNDLGILTGAGCVHGADVTIAVCTGTVTYVMYEGSPSADLMDYWTTVPAELRGGAGDDELWGGDGADLIAGDAGNDRLHGWTGEDQLFGGLGNDALHGETGGDVIEGDLGDDYLSGGSEVDCVSYQDHTASVTADLDGAAGDDGSVGEADTIVSDVECLLGGDGNDCLVGDGSDNLIEGGNGADVLFGLGGSDKLAGESATTPATAPGADWLYGGTGADWLIGNEGDDQLFGEDGDDRLEGGPGTDHCDAGPGGGTTSSCES
jgi:Ca2+-binding RTX toxin-like protein